MATENHLDRILFVDDDRYILDAMSRQFRGKYDMATAQSGAEGLVLLRQEKPFAVVVSDMRMPEMNGIQFLAKAQEVSPTTVRIMLTGNADLETAMHAVNEGNIFRFLVKPCHKDTTAWALGAAVRQYRLVVAEKELLEGTLKGSVKVLTDILALVNPAAFSRTATIRRYVKQVVQSMGLENAWQYELAALLSQIGLITVPPDTLEKYCAGIELSPDERTMIDGHPQVGEKLLARIPRLQIVAKMVGKQNTIEKEYTFRGLLPTDPAILGAVLLKLITESDLLVNQGNTLAQAITQLRKKHPACPPVILEAMKHIDVAHTNLEMKTVRIAHLTSSMILAEDVRMGSGILAATRGQQVTLSMRKLLENLAHRREIGDTITIYLAESEQTTNKEVACSTVGS